MVSVLKNKAYRRLFSAQVASLTGTGLATMALALLAYDLAGDDAGQVLGTALAIKMLAYIFVSPVASAFGERLPRRSFMMALDVVRALIVLALPFVTTVWQVYALIFLLQSASAGFTPTFQAVIPDILPSEKEYTKALSLARIAYDLESLLSPLFAAAALTIISFHGLFVGTSAGFLLSAALILSTTLPPKQPGRTLSESIRNRITSGIRIYLKTPRLRGLLSVTLSGAAASSIVIVNTIVLVKTNLGLDEEAYALSLAIYGVGSIFCAITLPTLLNRFSDRNVMITSAIVAAFTLLLLAGYLGAGMPFSWTILLAIWLFLGFTFSAIVTPSGRILRRSSQDKDRANLFAAQFSLSHICWLITYPLFGIIGSTLGQGAAIATAGALALFGGFLAILFWPRTEAVSLEHDHSDLSNDHPHLREGNHAGAHTHPFFIDDLHTEWPSHSHELLERNKNYESI